jgi:hypothetical protein
MSKKETSPNTETDFDFELDEETINQITKILSEPSNYNILLELNKTYIDFDEKVKEIEEYLSEYNPNSN